MLTSATAATYKVIQGNLLENGDFNSDRVDQYFWINPDDGIYRGGTCVPQKTGGVGNSGCVRMNGSNDVFTCPSLGYRNQVNTPMFAQVTAGKKYIAMVDIFRPEGVTATVRFDAENGRAMAYVETSKNGEWERLMSVFTADGTGDAYFRVFVPNSDLKENQYILIDNVYFAEYQEGVNYLETVSDDTPSPGSPETSDGVFTISAVVAVAVLTGVCVFTKKKENI